MNLLSEKNYVWFYVENAKFNFEPFIGGIV